MKTLQSYLNFNENKSIEELEYNILKGITSLENFKFELHFYELLLESPIYKPTIMNLYETLVNYKNELKVLSKNSTNLINELNSHLNLITKKIECEDIVCDNFFIKKQDDLCLKVFNFKTKIFNFKFRLFQYVEGTINN